MICIFIIESNGSGVNLLKIGSKRRKTQAEIEELKEEERVKEQAVQDKLAQFDRMAKQIAELQAENENNKAATNILSDMI